MFIFVYQNFKHDLPSWDYRRVNLESTRGQFDLPTLKRSLKDRFTLHGYGTHPLHQLAEKLGVYIPGHFVTIKDPKIAVWLKLNYDNISRADPYYGKTLKYLGGYKDIEDEAITKMTEVVDKIYTDLSIARTEYQRWRHLANQVATVVRQKIDDTQFSNIEQPMWDMAKETLAEMERSLNKVSSQIHMYESDISRRKMEFQSYLETHKL